MLEARLAQAETLKKVLDAVKELVTDANFDCSDEGIKLQAMDNSHVALVSLQLNSSGFQEYRCDRNMSLGMSLTSLQKIVKCAGNDDQLQIRADESQDVLGLLFENKNDRIAEYEMKLMDIDQEHLGIPDTVYDAEITLPATEFARVVRELKEMGESVKIEVTKDGVRFSADGDIGAGSITLKPTAGKARDDDSDEEEDDDEDDADEEAAKEEDDDEDVVIENAKSKTKGAASAEAEDEKPQITQAEITEDGDDEAAPKSTAASDDEDEDTGPKPRKKGINQKKPATKKRKASAPPAKSSKKAKAGSSAKAKDKDAGPKRVSIHLQQSVTLTFSIKYLTNFAKSTPLSEYVHLHMSNEVPLLVEYPFAEGHLRFYLAPKISDE